VFLLEFEVQNLRGELAALRATANMGENRRLTEQPLAGASVVGGGEGAVEVNEGDRFVTVKRGSRGCKGRVAGSQLVQTNRFGAIVVGDSIIRKVDRVICCKDPTCRTVRCLPGARGVDFQGNFLRPRATLRRQRGLREINAWLRDWCREEGFGFLQNWVDFSIGYRLFARDGLHLNDGAAALGEKMARGLEEILN
uniref:SGNH hydrolase-type esterase domain-containing protein n=1 Tax=Xenopus tropicalis TaxID=8364 RepID=A0A803K5V8_XENTR